MLTSTVSVSPTQQWRVDIGQCPNYTKHYLTTSSLRYLGWVYALVIVVAAFILMAGVVLTSRLIDKDTVLKVAVAKHEENSRAHRWILGYGACPV